jgi:predicted ferric reductase
MRNAAAIALLLAFYLALSLAPVALAALQPLARRPWPDELSSGLAMAGFAVLLMEFALSGRYRRLSARIGMDLTMRFHQMMALAALGLLILHPFLYTDYSQRPGGSGVQLTPAATVSGMAAWMLLVALVGFAWLRTHLPWTYETWRLTHGLGALAIAAFGLHHVLDTGRYSADPWLRGFWIAGGALALAALAWTYLARPFALAARRWRVAAVTPEAERLWRVVLEPVRARGFAFAAGQFVWLKLEHPYGLTEHPFSIASAPGQLPRLQFLVKESGDFTRGIGGVAPGTRAFVDGPYGNFTLAGRQGKGIVLIAGGVGVAPILSLARDLAATHDARPLTIVYADRNEGQLAARAELEAIAAAPGRALHLVLGKPLTAQALKACLPATGAADWLYFVCGPPGMIDAVENWLAGYGVPLGQIVSERFVYDTGIYTPRERLTRGVIAAAVAVQIAAMLAFVLR